MPRKDAAERYSPEMAAALSPGGTCRAATMKSSGVRATRMPRAPTTMVSRVTKTIAPSEASDIGWPARRVDEVGEPGLELAGLAVVEPADREQHRVEREAEHDQRERDAGHRHPADRGYQRRDDRERGGHRERERQAHQRQAELRAHQRAEQLAAVGGVVAQVAGPGDVVLQAHLLRPPHHQLADRGLVLARHGPWHGQLRLP